MKIGYITHEEATIKSFIKNPEYAEHLLLEVIKDGDKDEITYFQKLYDEAQVRRNNLAPDMDYWGSVASNAKLAVQDGQNLGQILSFLNDAVGTVKAAMA